MRAPRARPKPTPERVYRETLTTADPRALLAVRLGGQCGLRRGEIARIHSSHVEDDLSGYSLRVTGKGGHERIVPLPDDLAEEIIEAQGYTFPSPRGGHLPPRRDRSRLAFVLAHALDLPDMLPMLRGIFPKGVRFMAIDTTGSACRASGAATVAYAGTHDLRAVQELLGHSRPETTAGYVAVPDSAIRTAMLSAAA